MLSACFAPSSALPTSASVVECPFRLDSTTLSNASTFATRPRVRSVTSRPTCSTAPPGIWRFCACSARTAADAVSSWASSFSGSSQMFTWRSRPPTRLTWPTPLIDSIWRRSDLSANSVISRSGRAAESAIARTGEESGSNLSTTGVSISSGRSLRTPFTRSRTSWAATSLSFSRMNLTVTRETPSTVVDWSWSIPLIVLTASSILSVTSVSSSSGAAPSMRVVTVTVGKSTVGNRSTPSRK
jgi:hypothetical protein